MVSVDATEGVTMEATKGGILCVKFSNAEDMANYRATCIDKENGKNMTVQADLARANLAQPCRLHDLSARMVRAILARPVA